MGQSLQLPVLQQTADSPSCALQNANCPEGCHLEVCDLSSKSILSKTKT
jgi:hypothetical protein